MSEGHYILPEEKWVTVKDANGDDLPPVPEHWGPDELPAGAKKGKKVRKGSMVQAEESAEPEGSSAAVEPAKSASREAWADFARSQGAKEEDLRDKDGQPLGRDELRASYSANLS